MGVEQEQQRDLNERRAKLLEKRERRAQRNGERMVGGDAVEGDGKERRGTAYMG